MPSVKLPKGKYIVAVSGGVDSMALLDMLRRLPELELVVAHVNHGVRPDSAEDEELVRLFCMSHNVEYVKTELNLGFGVSEEAARTARYAFLQHCRIVKKARAILTAHHQDDLAETVLINLLRGTGWRGLTPLLRPNIERPLLNWTKEQLKAYASRHHVPWREDATNSDQTYLRNHIRLTLIPRMDGVSSTWRGRLLRLVRKQVVLRRTIEQIGQQWISQVVTQKDSGAIQLRRQALTLLPQEVAYELFQQLCRQATGQSLVRAQAEAAILFAKTALPGKRSPLSAEWQLRVTKTTLIVEPASAMLS